MVLKSIALFLIFSGFAVSAAGLVNVGTAGRAEAATAKTYLILPFNVEGNKQNAYLGKSLPAVFNSGLNCPGVAGRLDSYENFNKNPASGEADARKIQKSSGADYVVWGSIIFIGDECSLVVNVTDKDGKNTPMSRSSNMGRLSNDVLSVCSSIKAEVFGCPGASAGRGSGAADGVYAVPSAAQSAQQQAPAGRRSPAGINPSIRMEGGSSSDETRLRSQQLPYAARGMEVCDADGDGLKEIFIIDKFNLYAYRFENGRLAPLASTRVNLNLENLTIRSFDVNGDGTRQLLISSIDSEQYPRSRVYSFNGKELKLEMSNIRYFLNVLRDQNGVEMLIGQPADKYDMFRVNAITHMVKKGNTLEPGEALRLPKEINLYSFAYLPAGRAMDMDTKIISVSKLEKLKVWTLGNSLLHTGSEDYAGSPVYMEINPNTKGMGDEGISIKQMYYIPIRMLPVDLNQDGDWEIVTNYAVTLVGQIFKRYRNFYQSEIHGLYYDGTGMNVQWRTRAIQGGTVDVAITDFDNNGTLDLVVCINIGNEFTDRKSQVIGYVLDLSQVDERAGEGDFVRGR
ncbi:MAG: VCBS repeat-containing protein [Deltaproteobacteria bacterium]|nr:VCBS repeat-containing protein [Deltaproteobacteria bacterium]